MKKARAKATTTAHKLEELKAGREAKLTSYDLWAHQGEVPPPDVRAVLRLAETITGSKRASISWEAQEEALKYFNEHGLIGTLDRITALGGKL